MSRRFKQGWASLAFLLLLAPAAFGHFSGTNAYPLAGYPYPSPDPVPGNMPLWPNGPAGTSLQDVLDYIYQCQGCVDAGRDQSNASQWRSSTSPATLNPSLVVEFAGNQWSAEFGLWAGLDSPMLVPVFKGAAVGITGDFPSSASLQWNAAGTRLKVSGDPSQVVNGVYDFSSDAFGFYLRSAGYTWFSDDRLNNGSPQMLAYLGGNSTQSAGAWTLAFEDLPFNASDRDFNDFVIKIESLAAVPEPSSLILFGSVAVALAVALRRRLAN